LGILLFTAPFEGLESIIYYSSWAHCKARSGLPIIVKWTFLLRVVAEGYERK